MKKLFIIAVIALCAITARGQVSSLRTNTLMLATGTINAGIDVRLSHNVSLDIMAFGNPIKTPTLGLQHLAVQPSIRYWILETTIGPFFSAHPTLVFYNIANQKWQYRGYGAGLGFSWGYQWIISNQFSFSVEVGAGFMYSNDRQDSLELDYRQDQIIRYNQRVSLVPTKLEAAIIYHF